MKEGWNVILRYDEDFGGVNIWFIHKQGDIETVVNPLDFTMTTNLEPHLMMPEPTIKVDRTVSHQFLQGLADGLADTGFRPNELKSKDKELEATKYHLEDMRKLVNEALLPPALPSADYIREE